LSIELGSQLSLEIDGYPVESKWSHTLAGAETPDQESSDSLIRLLKGAQFITVHYTDRDEKDHTVTFAPKRHLTDVGFGAF
jgi:hypothetical protein